MPILAIDKYGRLYESDPDRHDGKGYKGKVPKVNYGDVTLGSAYLKSENDRINLERKSQAGQREFDKQESLKAHAEKQRRQRIHTSKRAALASTQNQASQDFLTLKGVIQTIREESPTKIGLSGDGLSSDGTGKTPISKNFMVGKIEQEQYRLKQNLMGALANGGYSIDASGNPSLGAVPGLPKAPQLPTTPLRVPAPPMAHPMAVFMKRG